MGKTSSAVKRRYNAKTYRNWTAALKFEFYDELEAAKGSMSRPEFLKVLLDSYKASKEPGE